jgi:hypothetical protein
MYYSVNDNDHFDSDSWWGWTPPCSLDPVACGYNRNSTVFSITYPWHIVSKLWFYHTAQADTMVAYYDPDTTVTHFYVDIGGIGTSLQKQPCYSHHLEHFI